MVVTVSADLLNRNVSREPFKLIAIGKGEHLVLWVSHHFLERIHFSLGVR